MNSTKITYYLSGLILSFTHYRYYNMGEIGSAIGTGLSIVSGIFGGLSASKANKRVKKDIESQREENKEWYNRSYNEDATQRASAQRMLAKTEEALRMRNKQMEGAMAVTGSTEESVAAQKAANAQALAETASQIAVDGERRKDAIERQYMAKEDALRSELHDVERNRANQTAQAVQGVAGYAGNLKELL